MISIIRVALLSFLLLGCQGDPTKGSSTKEVDQTSSEMETLATHLRPFKDELPTIGLLIYGGVLITEVTAAADVFSKNSKDGKQLFNVVTIAEDLEAIVSEEGLRIIPDYTFESCPKLDVLFIPSAYDMYTQVHNERILDFIKRRDQETSWTVSNCAGANLIGASGIADGRKIVTWIGGGEQLQKDYPKLIVQDDRTVTYVEDGKFISSNGNLASYISALNLVEKMTSSMHRNYIEEYLYLDRLQNWK